MSFRVFHYAGNKELLLEKVNILADQLKEIGHDEYSFAKNKWQAAVDAVAQGDFSDTKLAPLVVYLAIREGFQCFPNDLTLGSCLYLADRTTGKLAHMFHMFIHGRNVATGNAPFGVFDGEITCGYLSADEVKELLVLLKAEVMQTTDKGVADSINDLITIFSELAEQDSGDLFTMD